MKNLIVTLLFTCMMVGVANAQSPWLSDSRVSSVSIEWDKPLFDDNMIDRDEVTGVSSSLFITGRYKLNDNFRFQVELPISHFGYANNNPIPEGDNNSTVIGNIYVGGILDIEAVNTDDHQYFEVGVRFPSSREPNGEKRFGSVTGMTSEASDRMEAFLWDTWSIPLSANYIATLNGPFAVKLRLGTLFNIFYDDLDFLENELHLTYGVAGLYRESNFEASLGFSGRNPYIGNDPDFMDDGFTQLRAGISRPFRNIVPGIYARQPLGKNYSRMVDFAYGFYIEIRQ